MRFVFTLVLTALTVPIAQAQDIIGINWSGEVYELDLSGSGNFLGDSGVSQQNSMAVNPTTGEIYVAGGSGLPNGLYTIDPSNGSATFVAYLNLRSVRGMAFSPTGTLYVVNDSDPFIGEDFLGLQEIVWQIILVSDKDPVLHNGSKWRFESVLDCDIHTRFS